MTPNGQYNQVPIEDSVSANEALIISRLFVSSNVSFEEDFLSFYSSIICVN